MPTKVKGEVLASLWPRPDCGIAVLQVLQETFSQFVCETNSLGQQRLEQVNKLANEMIKCGHSDAAAVAEWKDGLNESWADLLELMETRTQMLAASQQLHRFFTDCKEVGSRAARPLCCRRAGCHT